MLTDNVKKYYASLVTKTLLTAQASLDQMSDLTDAQFHDLKRAHEHFLAECQRTEPSLIPVDIKPVQVQVPVQA